MIKSIKKWFSLLFCDHVECRHIRDIGGDEQMHHYVKGGGLARSEWVCCDCGSIVYKSFRASE